MNLKRFPLALTGILLSVGLAVTPVMADTLPDVMTVDNVPDSTAADPDVMTVDSVPDTGNAVSSDEISDTSVSAADEQSAEDSAEPVTSDEISGTAEDSLALSVEDADIEVQDLDSPEVVPVITSGKTREVTLTADSNEYFISFTPKTSTEYVFYSTGDYDTVGTIYTSGFDPLEYDDDTGSANNFRVTVNLKAGETYYLSSKMYEEGTEGTFSVTIKKVRRTLETEALFFNIYGQSRNSSGYYPGNGDNAIIFSNVSSKAKITVKSSSSDLKATYTGKVSGGVAKIMVYPKKKGTYTVTVKIGSTSYKIPVTVGKFYFRRNSLSNLVDDGKTWTKGVTTLCLARDESTQLKLKGVPEGTKVRWTSSDKSKATVDANGVVTGVGRGYCSIIAEVDGATLKYEVCVSYKKAIQALRYAVEHFGSTYSQANRMKVGYYDCSSYAWRSYKESSGMIIGTMENYAPTAADMCKWCKENGYVIYDSTDTVPVSQLLPGDLIFETGKSNGRYLGIYHVDFYQGSYSTLSVETKKHLNATLKNVVVARPCLVNTVPDTPTLRTEVNAGGTVTLAWDGVNGAQGYCIYTSTTKNGTYKLKTTIDTGIVTTYTQTGLTKGTVTYYKIRAFKIFGDERLYSTYSVAKKVTVKK